MVSGKQKFSISEVAKELNITDISKNTLNKRLRDLIKNSDIKPGLKSGSKKKEWLLNDKQKIELIKLYRNKWNKSDKKDDKEIAELKKKIEELEQLNESLNLSLKKKDEEISQLNSKIEGYADDFRDMNKAQMVLTKKYADLADNNKENEEEVKRLKNRNVWQRLLNK